MTAAGVDGLPAEVWEILCSKKNWGGGVESVKSLLKV